MTRISQLWENYTAHEFASIDDVFLRDFRAPGSANKFVAWDPFERSTRYFKFLLQTVAMRQPSEFFEAYKEINCNFGNPLSVKIKGYDINADYLAAVEEYLFIKNTIALSDVNKIVEIGAGFGRTAHTVLTLCPTVEEYVIVDLPAILSLSIKYLEQVAPDKFNRVKFIRSDDYESQSLLCPDLVINIDSFQEMPSTIIDGYMDRIIKNTPRFYCKNPIGKYLPETVGLPELPLNKRFDVFDIGKCTKIIDIFNDTELSDALSFYLAAYMPPEFNYKVVRTKAMDLFPYFYHALYVKE